MEQGAGAAGEGGVRLGGGAITGENENQGGDWSTQAAAAFK